MGCKRFVALRLEVAHHFIERRPGRLSRSLEPPATFGATKTPKMLLLNPYQLSAHGEHMLQALIGVVCRASYGRGSFAGRLISGPGLGVKWNRLIVGHVSRVVDVWVRHSGEVNVRYPTEAACWNLYTPPSRANKQSSCFAHQGG
jgi:hypothetical protein